MATLDEMAGRAWGVYWRGGKIFLPDKYRSRVADLRRTRKSVIYAGTARARTGGTRAMKLNVRIFGIHDYGTRQILVDVVTIRPPARAKPAS